MTYEAPSVAGFFSCPERGDKDTNARDFGPGFRATPWSWGRDNTVLRASQASKLSIPRTGRGSSDIIKGLNIEKLNCIIALNRDQ